ncbi:MAG: hypothetical protein ACK5NK_13575 [Niabella sp.]
MRKHYLPGIAGILFFVIFMAIQTNYKTIDNFIEACPRQIAQTHMAIGEKALSLSKKIVTYWLYLCVN